VKEDNKLAMKNTSDLVSTKKKMKRSMLEKKKQSQEKRRTNKEAVGLRVLF